jgi:hypothetical protein
MINVENNADKFFTSKVPQVDLVAITECLTDHSKCSGRYIDTLIGTYVIKCNCSCHSQ